MTDFSHLSIGFFKGRILAISPTDEEYLALFQEEPEKELSYVWESKGVRTVRIDFYIQSPQEEIFKHSIYLKDEDKVSKTNKFLYVNCVGASQWVESQHQLWESFENFEKVLEWEGGRPKSKKIIGTKQHHISKVGEDELLDMYRILENSNIYDENTNLFFDLEKIFQGDFSELRERAKSDAYNLVALAYVQEEKQKIWSRFLPSELYREINVGSFSKSNQKIFNEFTKNLTSEYSGIDGTYILSKLRPMQESDIVSKYNPTEDGLDYDNSITYEN